MSKWSVTGRIGVTGLVVLALLFTGGIIGYVMNIVKAFSDTGWHLLLRIAGMIMPIVGAIIGWL